MGIVRRTKSVQALLNAFENNNKALSAVYLIDLLGKEMNKTTIYRILDKLEEDGIVHSFWGSDGLRWYAKCDGCDTHKHFDTHPHFQCSKCGNVECLSIDIEIPVIKNHQVDSTEIILIGKCEQCI